MAARLDPIVVSDLRGGRNDTDAPMSLPLTQATEFLNCDWKDTIFARKRGGATAVSQTGGTTFTIGIQTLERHVPGAVETAAELWAIDGAATPIWKRLTGGTTWADVSVADAVSTRPQDVQGVALNGKRFFAYDSTVDRLHVYDPATSNVRRVGINPGSSAPSAANKGSGTNATAVLRYYRVRFLQISGSSVVRKSEPTPSVQFTPSGSGGLVTITRPTAPGEGETHWHIEVSLDDATYYVVTLAGGADTAGIAIATTTGDDAIPNHLSVATRPVSVQLGLFTLFPSVKSLITDGNRILGAGAWEASGATSGGKNSRVWFTPVLGSADKGDDERVPNTTTQKNWVDLNENDGGAITGMGGPLSGLLWAFKYRQVWKLQPTGDVVAPYIPRKMRDDIGCIHHKTIAIGDDQWGRAALYFLSHRGPYRVTQDGDIEYLGRDNEVTWRAMNLAATTVVAHSTYYPDRHQWWLWIATGSSNDPDVKMMFDVQLGVEDEHNQIRGGWAKHTGDSAGARCSCLFSNTIAASMSRDLKPHLGRSVGTVIGKCDTTDVDDFGTDFQGLVTSRPLLMTPDLRHKVGMREPTLLATALAGSDVTVTLTRDFGLETRSQAVSLAPTASETRVVRKVEGLEMGEADVLQISVGDSAANDERWSVDALIVPIVHQEPR